MNEKKYNPINFVSEVELKTLANYAWQNVRESMAGDRLTEKDRKKIAVTIQRMAKRSLGSTEEFRNSELILRDDGRWEMPGYDGP